MPSIRLSTFPFALLATSLVALAPGWAQAEDVSAEKPIAVCKNKSYEVFLSYNPTKKKLVYRAKKDGGFFDKEQTGELDFDIAQTDIYGTTYSQDELDLSEIGLARRIAFRFEKPKEKTKLTAVDGRVPVIEYDLSKVDAMELFFNGEGNWSLMIRDPKYSQKRGIDYFAEGCTLTQKTILEAAGSSAKGTSATQAPKAPQYSQPSTGGHRPGTRAPR